MNFTDVVKNFSALLEIFLEYWTIFGVMKDFSTVLKGFLVSWGFFMQSSQNFLATEWFSYFTEGFSGCSRILWGWELFLGAGKFLVELKVFQGKCRILWEVMNLGVSWMIFPRYQRILGCGKNFNKLKNFYGRWSIFLWKQKVSLLGNNFWVMNNFPGAAKNFFTHIQRISYSAKGVFWRAKFFFR